MGRVGCALDQLPVDERVDDGLDVLTSDIAGSGDPRHRRRPAPVQVLEHGPPRNRDVTTSVELFGHLNEPMFEQPHLVEQVGYITDHI